MITEISVNAFTAGDLYHYIRRHYPRVQVLDRHLRESFFRIRSSRCPSYDLRWNDFIWQIVRGGGRRM